MAGRTASRLARRAFETRFAKFAAVGASGVVVNLVALWLLAGVLGMREVIASALAIEASIVWNFVLNNAITYRDRNAYAQADVGGRLLRYNLVSLVGLGVQLGTFVLLRLAATHLLGREELGGWRYAAQCAGIALAMIWNFVAHLRFTWRQDPGADPRRLPLPRAAQG